MKEECLQNKASGTSKYRKIRHCMIYLVPLPLRIMPPNECRKFALWQSVAYHQLNVMQ